MTKRSIREKTIEKVSIAQATINNITINFDKLIKEVVMEAIEGKIEQSKINDILAQAKSLREAQIILDDFTKVLRYGDVEKPHRRMSETDKQRIFFYYKTGEYNQEDIARVFNTTQATVSRIIRQYKGQIKIKKEIDKNEINY